MGTLAKMLERIEQRAEALNLTDNAIAVKSGHPDCVRNIRRTLERGGGRGPSGEIVASMADVLQCAPSWLRGEPNAPEPPPPTVDETAILGEIARLEREIRDRNKKIADLKSKIKTSDQSDSRKKSRMR